MELFSHFSSKHNFSEHTFHVQVQEVSFPPLIGFLSQYHILKHSEELASHHHEPKNMFKELRSFKLEVHYI